MRVLRGLSGPRPGHGPAACPPWGWGTGDWGRAGPAGTNLVVDVLAGRRAARGQDVVVVAVVDDQDAPGPHHAGNVPQGQLVITLVPWRGNYGVSKHWLCPICPHLTHTHVHTDTQIAAPTIVPPISSWRAHSPTHGMSSGMFPASLEQSVPRGKPTTRLCGASLGVPPALPDL